MMTHDPMAAAPLEARIVFILEELRPFLKQDGGDMDFLGVENGVVQIRMKGACVACPSSQATLRGGIESRLMRDIPEVVGVRAIPA